MMAVAGGTRVLFRFQGCRRAQPLSFHCEASMHDHARQLFLAMALIVLSTDSKATLRGSHTNLLFFWPTVMGLDSL
jgi:hypothetical protein